MVVYIVMKAALSLDLKLSAMVQMMDSWYHLELEGEQGGDIAMKAAFSLDLKPNAVVSFHCCFNYHIWLGLFPEFWFLEFSSFVFHSQAKLHPGEEQCHLIYLQS